MIRFPLQIPRGLQELNDLGDFLMDHIMDNYRCYTWTSGLTYHDPLPAFMRLAIQSEAQLASQPAPRYHARCAVSAWHLGSQDKEF
jgi:hypothetical protein